MAIFSIGFSPCLDHESEQDFLKHLDLILRHEDAILHNQSYFFVDLPFCFASWPYVGGDGPLYLGYLLLGWRDGILTDCCGDCQGKVLLTSLSGSPLSGTNSYAGICKECRQKTRGTSRTNVFAERVQFISTTRRSFARTRDQVEEFDGYEFSFEGNGLKPVRKKRMVTVDLASPVTLSILTSKLEAQGGPKKPT